MKIPLPSEHDIQTVCNNYLWIRGWYVMRLNSGRIPYKGKDGKTRNIMLAEPGTPDTIAFKQRPKGMCVLFVEYKRPGKKPTYLQQQKMAQLREHGAFVTVISSLEQLKEYLGTIDL